MSVPAALPSEAEIEDERLMNEPRTRYFWDYEWGYTESYTFTYEARLMHFVI